VQPTLDLLVLEIDAFGLTVVLAYVTALLVIVRRAREKDVPTQWAAQGVLACMVGGLVGARLWNVVDEGGGDHLDALLTGGGLTWYGGLLGGSVAGIAYTQWRAIPLGLVVDTAAFTVPLVQAIGRVGCQLSGDGDYGSRSDLPWAMGYPDGVVPTPPGVQVHPTPIYEALALGVIALVLWRRRDRHPPGVLFGLYLVLGGLQRFLVEFVRLNEETVTGLTTAQHVSLALIALGAAILAWGGRMSTPGFRASAVSRHYGRRR
jgi:phosphatidylglycerol---prolipoprotein diacylglyceryl transferase